MTEQNMTQQLDTKYSYGVRFCRFSGMMMVVNLEISIVVNGMRLLFIVYVKRNRSLIIFKVYHCTREVIEL